MAILEYYPQVDLANDFWTPSITGSTLSALLLQAQQEPASPLRYMICGASVSASGSFRLSSNIVMTHVVTRMRIGIVGRKNQSAGNIRQIEVLVQDANGVSLVGTPLWDVTDTWTKVYAPITDPTLLATTDLSNYRLVVNTASNTKGKAADRREAWIDSVFFEITTDDAQPLGGAGIDGNFFNFF
jgi:hypothetical protein